MLIEVQPAPTAHHASGFTVTDDAIAKLAYSKFLARGGEHGHDEDDWASAKRDLLIGAGGA
jgi:hypothetical protein